MADVQSHLNSGTLQPDDLAWYDGCQPGKWVRLSSIPGIAGNPLPPPTAERRPPSPSRQQQTTTSGLAVSSMVLGILGFFTFAITAIPAVICGHLSMSKIKKADGGLSGRGLAIAGLITGYLGFIGWAIVAALTVFFFNSTIALPALAGKSQQEKIAAAKTQIRSFTLALDNYEIDNGAYPKSGDLDALVNAPTNSPGWKGPYIDKIPLDPWNNPYTYLYPGRHNPNGYDLWSNGPDGRPDTDDDITNWDGEN